MDEWNRNASRYIDDRENERHTHKMKDEEQTTH